ncbi:MAG: ABC transporter permease [Longispora sp.]|nr:ABC transporter permease [Longispora sp. (in: high G+C Gram-positive bacteria)]
MLKATLKSLLSRKLRLLLSALAVVLGVMFVSGAFVLTDTLGRTFDGLFSSIYQGVDVQVAGKTKENTGGPPTADPVPASLVETVLGIPGVDRAEGQVFADGAKLIGKNGKLIAGANRFGASWTEGSEIIQLREGRAPATDTEIAVNGLLQEASEYNIGDTVSVLTPYQPRQEFTIVGVYGYTGDRASLAGEQTIAFTVPVAQQYMLGTTGAFSMIEVRSGDKISSTELRDRIRAVVGDDYDVRTGEELTKASADDVKEGLGFFNFILLGFAAVALLVGIFLILNTFSIIVAQRTRELALMRALGASGRQVITAVLIEALLIGLIASVVGFALGVGVGALLVLFVGQGLGGLTLSSLSVPSDAVIASFAVGMLVTLIAALMPAVRASRIPPLAAMRDAANTSKPLTKLTIGGAIVTALGITGLWLALSGIAEGTGFGLALGGGLLLAFTGVALLTPAIGKPVVSLLGTLFSWSTPGKLGKGNSARNPRRTAITAAALMIGIALITGVSVLLTSVKASITQTIDKGLSAELIVSGQQTGPLAPTFDRAALIRMADVQGVSSVNGMYYDAVSVNDKPSFVGVITDLPAATSVMKIEKRQGAVGQLQPGQALTSEKVAAEKNLKVGSPITVQLSRGEPATYTISGIYADNEVLANFGFLLPDDTTKDFLVPSPVQAYIKLADGADITNVKAQIDTILADSPEVSVNDRSSFVKQTTSIFDALLVFVQILLALAIIIAVIGVINTLVLSMFERTRELGLLRAVGMGRAQIMTMVTVESIVISVFGALLGIGVGAGLGAAVVQALRDEGFSTLALPWGQMFAYVLLAVIVGVLAAIIPAIRAARTDILKAIAYE